MSEFRLSNHLRQSFELGEWIVRQYLADLEDEDLLIRPIPEANHIAWQLGHLISGENRHMNTLRPDGMPPLPEGFREAHTKQTARLDSRDSFWPKASYLDLFQQQRSGTIALLESLDDQDLESPCPSELGYFGPTVATVFSGEANHWMMHTGQWVVVRRKLGRAVLF